MIVRSWARMALTPPCQTDPDGVRAPDPGLTADHGTSEARVKWLDMVDIWMRIEREL